LIEPFILTILTLLVIAIIRPGKTPPLDNLLTIQRPGQHHMTLAPQLNLAQPLLETISKEIRKHVQPQENSATQCFEARDSDNHSNTLMEFAHAVLTHIPAPDAYNAEAGEQIAVAASIAAQQHQVEIKHLPG
jgi:hypothetical protein